MLTRVFRLGQILKTESNLPKNLTNIKNLGRNTIQLTSSATVAPFAQKNNSLTSSYRAMSSSLPKQSENKHHLINPITRFEQKEEQESKNGYNRTQTQERLGQIGGTFTLLAGLGLSYFLYKEALQPRENEILVDSKSLEEKNKRHPDLVNMDDFEVIGKKPKGDLSGAIVRHKKTGKEYIKKGAKDAESFWIEYVISNFLAALYPDIQPECLVMSETQADGNSRLYTLSRYFPKSMDLEEFIRQGDYKEKLAKKPLKGLARALAADLLFAEQRDIKYANLIIIEKDDGYYAATIDHEMSALRAKFMMPQVGSFTDFNLDLDDLIEHIRDLHPKDEDNHAGLAGDVRAREFANFARPFMSEELLIEFYQKVADQSCVDILTKIKKLNGKAGILDPKQADQLVTNIQEVVNKAEIFLVKNKIELENNEPTPPETPRLGR